ncbi:MAG: transcription elongation factor GreA [Candidatus Cloacimonetes bacterium]|nr:transcription elongation factor GreA [Candidatus Cloacimonadota bacterium]
MPAPKKTASNQSSADANAKKQPDNYITIEGMQLLQKKRQTLLEERPQVIEQIQTAREMGDLSENAEYHAARERQRNLDRELGYIDDRIAILKVIDPAKLPKDTIRFGAYVSLKETLDGQKALDMSLHLVGPDEIYDRDDGVLQVSFVSPLGAAMIGKKVKDTFTVDTPKGKRTFLVKEIK